MLFRSVMLVLEGHSRSIIISVFPQLSYLGSTDGVDIFFVLSGFLIGGILIRYCKFAEFDGKLFLIRRWYRTIPNYVVAFLVSLILYLFLNKDSLWNFKLVFATGIFAQNYLPPFENFSFFSEAWSLSIEEHFYLTFTLILFFFYRFSPKNIILKSILVLTGIAFISRLVIFKMHPIYNYDLYNSYIRIITPCRFDSMAVGVFFAYLKSAYPQFYNKKQNRSEEHTSELHSH